jgi:hypothetical protein
MDDLLDYEDTDVEEYESDLEFAESEELEERRRRPRFRPRTPSGQGLYRSRPTAGSVTQAQLQTALTRVGQQIKSGSDATKQLAARVNTLVERLDREITGRKKADAEQKKAAGQSSTNMMLPLLLMQSSPEVSDKDGEKPQRLGIVKRNPAAGTTPASVEVQEVEVLSADGKALDKTENPEVVTKKTKFKSADMMLPLVLMMGMGGMSGGGGDNNMMMLMLVMMMQKK